MEPLAVLIYSHRSGYLPLLEYQLKQAGIEQHHIVDPEFSWRRRIIFTRDAGRLFPNRLLVFPDAWDTVLLGTKSELIALGLETCVTLAGAKNCWPDSREADYASKQGDGLSPWRYVNSNPLAGIGNALANIIDWGWERFPLKGDSRDIHEPAGEVCERFWTNLYLDTRFDIRIDSECRLSQSFISSVPGELKADNGRLHNLVTGSTPVFFHLNGNHLLPEGLVALQ